MKAIMKIGLVMVLCVGLLLVAGCKKNAGTNQTPATTQPATQPQGTQPQGGNNGGENNGQATPTNPTNPEGDPFDAVPDATDENGNPVVVPTEPIIGVDDGSSNGNGNQEAEDDFEVDFGELGG